MGYYGGASFFIEPNSDDYYNFRGGAKARYYIQMSKKWYIYPELGLGFDATFDGGNKSDRLNLDFVKSVGFNYFVSPNVALDVNLDLGFRSNKNEFNAQTQKSSNFNSDLRIGVTYFIDKLF